MSHYEYFHHTLKTLIANNLRIEVQASTGQIKAIRANDINGKEHLIIEGNALFQGPVINGRLLSKRVYGISVREFITLLKNPDMIRKMFEEV